jgi:hypothetical protein
MPRAHVVGILLSACSAAACLAASMCPKGPSACARHHERRDAGAGPDLGEGSAHSARVGPAELCAVDQCVDALAMKSVSSGLGWLQVDGVACLLGQQRQHELGLATGRRTKKPGG